MPKRITAADARAPAEGHALRVAVVTMDSHLASAALRAGRRVAAEMPGFTLAFHPADIWAADEAALAACLADIAAADIVIVSMLFLDDHIRRVLPALLARRDDCAAMVCCLSAGEVTRLTRLGRFDMSASGSGVISMLKRLRGAKGTGATAGERQMRMLRQMPRLLRFVPGTAQDMRAYFLVLQYWLAASEENLAGLLRLLVRRVTQDGAGTKIADPIRYPDTGLYHPRARNRITETRADLPQGAGEAGTVGLLVLRSTVLAGNTGHYDGAIAALEARGLRVVPAFASGLDARPAMERFFFADGRPAVDAVVSLTGFSLVGGPAYNDARAAEAMLARLDVPYITAHPLEFQTIRRWESDPRGLLPVEATMMVAIPEIDGGIWPMTFGGRCGGAEQGARCEGCDGVSCTRDMVPHPERAAMLAARVAKLVALRRAAAAERRVAVVLFDFPPNSGAAGTAAYLDVFASLLNLLRRMQGEGYTVDVPSDVAALRARVLDGNSARFGTAANLHARIDVADHVRRTPWLAEIEAVWGAAPGRQNTDGSALFILGAQFGNVFVGLQPAFGVEGDPMRLLFDRGFAPTHAFTAFYRWMREDFGAHAVLHFGTHGALEFMPGKQVGLSAACWPDRLIGDLPNLYLYASNNPSEGMIAKRRTGAALVSYLTPPVTAAGLYRGLLDLKTSIDRWRGLEPDTSAETRHSLGALIQAQAATLDLAAASPAWDMLADETIRTLSAALLELEYTLIPHGLHVVGEAPSPEARGELLDAAGIGDPAERARLDALLAGDAELSGLVHALAGGYIRPAPGGDVLRTTEVLPTGRNLHGFDPWKLPSAWAVRDGAEQAARLLARHEADGNLLPETIAFVLWGTDNLKSEGGPIAQVLALLGARPRFDGYGRLIGAELIDLAVLGRPRIDVIVTLSGIFRDLLPLQTKLLAEAALLAARADEDIERNFVRKHALAHVAQHGGRIEDAALRVFGNADGAYGANVNAMVGEGAWAEEDELADVFLRRKGFAYGVDGGSARADGVLRGVLATVDATYQNLDSVEVGVTTIDHYFDSLGGMSRAVRAARGGRAAAVYIGDQTRGTGTVRTLGEQVALETRTRALNPKWYEGLLRHGFEGVREIEAHVTNTVGWSATTGEVEPWVYQRITEVFVLDDAMRRRMAELNPKASMKIANRLLEAHDRNYWQPGPEMLDALRRAGEELEDRLEGVAA